MFTRPRAKISGGGSFYPKSIPYSLRCDSARSTYLSKTFGTPTSNTTWSLSAWVKKSTLGVLQTIFGAGTSLIQFDTNNCLSFYKAGVVATSTPVFRDASGHGHLFVRSNGTTVAAYWNNVLVLSYTGTLDALNTAVAHAMGRDQAGATSYFDGYLSDFYFVDGQALTPSSFGQASPLAPNVWVPKAWSGTYGTNGFHLEFGNASALGTDTSGNGNTFASSGFTSSDQFTDTPTNNFCTFNPVDRGSNAPDLRNGGLRAYGSSSYCSRGNFSFSSGKWYAEVDVEATNGGWYPELGVAQANSPIPTAGNVWGSVASGANVICPDGRILEDTSNPRTLTSYTTGDKIALAYDADNLALYVGKISGGITTWMNSGVPTSGASKTGAASTNFTAGVLYSFTNGSSPSGDSALWNFGATAFAGTPPTGYKSPSSANMPDPLADIVVSGSFTGNASTEGPFINVKGTLDTLTINGNAVTWGTHADKLANGFKLRTSSSSYNASGTNTWTATATSARKFPRNNAQGNP